MCLEEKPVSSHNLFIEGLRVIWESNNTSHISLHKEVWNPYKNQNFQSLPLIDNLDHQSQTFHSPPFLHPHSWDLHLFHPLTCLFHCLHLSPHHNLHIWKLWRCHSYQDCMGLLHLLEQPVKWHKISQSINFLMFKYSVCNRSVTCNLFHVLLSLSICQFIKCQINLNEIHKLHELHQWSCIYYEHSCWSDEHCHSSAQLYLLTWDMVWHKSLHGSQFPKNSNKSKNDLSLKNIH